ncbi:hypothetical protein FBUS_05861, partial [Fasciolopsis buskii]
TLLQPNGPGLGVALLLHDNTQAAFLLGTLKHWLELTGSIYRACLNILAQRDDAERRETILCEARLRLPIPVEWSVHGCPEEVKQKSVGPRGEVDLPNERLAERSFKPLFYTDTGLYCASMPVQINPDDIEDLINPGDGLVLRPVRLGILVTHVTASVPPGMSLQSVEHCVSTCAL